jgi:hypothetical protein
MILDYSGHPKRAKERRFAGATVTVDGVQINQVFFVDTRRGIVKTYDVKGDGKIRVLDDPGLLRDAAACEKYTTLRAFCAFAFPFDMQHVDRMPPCDHMMLFGKVKVLQGAFAQNSGTNSEQAPSLAPAEGPRK